MTACAAVRPSNAGRSRTRTAPPSRLAQRAAQDPESVAALLQRARTGDDRAWERLHERFAPMLRRIARSYRLSPTDVDDVVQNSWLALFNHIDRVREPAAVAAWLATTTRRECLRLLQRPLRESLVAEIDDSDARGDVAFADPERAVMAAERRVALGHALATLPDRHRRLMTLLSPSPTWTTRGSAPPWRCRSEASDRSALAASRGSSAIPSCAISMHATSDAAALAH